VNKNIQKLYNIAQKPTRNIIGLMSGTSMDGLDVALCQYQGSGFDTKIKVLNFETVSFNENIKTEIRKIFAKQIIDFQQLCLLNPWLGNLHGQLVNQCLAKWGVANSAIDFIASHGQTVFHSPKILHNKPGFPNATLQIADGDHLAVTTGIITLSDFRQKHCAAGGEGAPLAVYGDFLIFSKKDKNRVLLNMGGISNFTFLAGDLDPLKVFATDTGPGNTIIDAFVQKHYSISYDQDAKIALKGKISEPLLWALKQNDFFAKPLPKTTGPELFNLEYLNNAQGQSQTSSLCNEDVLATLCRFSAETIAECIQRIDKNLMPNEVFMSGGGMHNPLLVSHLKALFPNTSFYKTDELGIDGDAKEAVLFATLANEALCGGNTDFGSRGGVPSVSMGKISFPD
jgi:anhydro-N-acetylmuramic acid kinase